MRHQLKIVGKEHKMEAALEEAAHVRKDFGYPIMVTPLSQYVGTQAAINVFSESVTKRCLIRRFSMPWASGAKKRSRSWTPMLEIKF